MKMTPLLLAIATLGAIASALLATHGTSQANNAIIATFDVQGEAFRVRIENSATIMQVRALEDGSGTATIPNGRILRGSDGNAPWSWHLDPDDIEMAEFAIELCDGTPSLVEDDVDYWVDTVGRFCPWSATLVSVEEVAEPIGVCIDPVGTFQPTQISGACISYEQGKDQQLLIGRALVGGSFAPPGTAVQALVGEQVCGETTDGDPFQLLVFGAGEQEGCARAGDTVRFLIGGQDTLETLRWPEEPSGFQILALTAVHEQAWYWFERISTPRPERGMVVQAFVAGELCDETTVGGEEDAAGYSIPDNIRGFSRLVVGPVASPPSVCGLNGALVEFRVNGIRAETAVVWRPGIQRLNLMVQGDATCDFLVDSRDANLALQVTAGLISSVPCHGDGDRDRDIDVFDARHILEFTAGITSALPI
jgi:hypothetical protein